jgi:16S rRNA (cytidine1402-2'-O)-methyltransferase
VVSTPIGNLEDLTFRARDVLGSVKLIACEDTRMTRKLLTRHQIRNRVISFHARSRESAAEKIVRSLHGGSVAYVTDSGTPTVSDPGAALVRRVLEAGMRVVPVPGPSAVHAALAGSGFAFSEYTFAGFLSNKPARRRKKLSQLRGLKTLLVFFESPHRLLAMLHDAHELFGDIPCVVAKEMTKRFERFYRGSMGEIVDMIEADGVRGEYTVILDNRGRE